MLSGQRASARAPVGPPFFEDRGKPKPKSAPTRPATRPATKPASAPATRPAATKPATAPAVALAPPKLPPPPLAGRADAALRRGLDYLYRTQRADGTWQTKYALRHPGGVESLVLLTALSAGEDVRQPKLAAALKYVDQTKPRTVYVRAVRAMAYTLLPAADREARLTEDVAWLANYQGRSGGWGYGPGDRTTREKPSWTDLSNTFLATWAIREGAAAGADVPDRTWSRCRFFWSKAANADGGLSYQPPGGMGFRLRGSSYGSMTTAGATAMFFLSDRLAAAEEPDFANTGPRRTNAFPFQGAIDRALKWLASHVALDKNPEWVWGPGEAYEYYYLFVLQQLADEGGLWRIGRADLARDAAEVLVARQRPDGSWGDPALPADAGDKNKLDVIRTCFALLALLKARAPVAIQKLRLPGEADNDPRDAANVARWISRALGQPTGWRQATLQASDDLLARAPVLYVRTALKDFPKPTAAKLAAFLARGGTVLVQPFAADKDVAEAVKVFVARSFPQLKGEPVPDSHPVYSLRFKVSPAERPRLFGFGDACRTRIFILLSDASGPWHQGRTRKHPQPFELAANLVLYATDLGMPKSKLAPPAAVPEPVKPIRTLKVARIRHAGGWDVCPRGLERVSDALARAVSVGLNELQAVDLAQPVDRHVTLLWLTGTRGAGLGAAQKRALKDYLLAGGTLVADSAMGGEEFFQDASSMLAEMFGPANVKDLSVASPLLTGRFAGGIGCDVTRVDYTRAAKAERPELLSPELKYVQIDGRIAVVLSRYSIVCSLRGEPIYGLKGLAASDAARLAANLVLYAATRPRAAGPTTGTKPTGR